MAFHTYLAILLHLRDGGQSKKELSKKFGITEKAVAKSLTKLNKEKLIQYNQTDDKYELRQDVNKII
jgi:predicted transcriptional regulator